MLTFAIVLSVFLVCLVAVLSFFLGRVLAQLADMRETIEMYRAEEDIRIGGTFHDALTKGFCDWPTTHGSYEPGQPWPAPWAPPEPGTMIVASKPLLWNQLDPTRRPIPTIN